MKSSFFRPTSFLSGALAFGGLTLAGCGGGTSPQRPLPTATPGPSTPSPNPTAPGGAATLLNLIVFTSNRDGNNEIYSMNPDGTAQTRLTTAGAPDNSPSRARNGSRIVFSSERDGNPEIYTMGLGGEADALLRLTTDGGASAPDDTSPVFSADGSKIAWISTRGVGSNVWTMDSTGANQSQFTTEGNVSTPAFSPDGRDIAYAVTRPNSGGAGAGSSSVIVTKNIASGVERVVVQGAFDARAPRYSPNGTSLVFTAQTTGSDARRLQIVNLASGAISDGPGQGNGAGNFGVAASFSPDGTRLAFETVSAQSPQIGVSSGLSGQNVNVVTSQGLNFAPSWGQ